MPLQRPVFNQNRVFYFLAPTEVFSFGTSEPSYIVTEALKTSQLDVLQVEKELKTLLTTNGRVFRALKNLFPDIESRVSKLSADIILDEYKSHIFRSFYLRPSQYNERAIISLDTSARTRSYWGPLLAHEYVHALLAESGLPAWAEEMLAQLIEAEAAGTDPVSRLETLRTSNALPALFEQKRPLQDTQTYALTYLFGRYLKDNFGDWLGLQSLVFGSCGGSLNSKQEWSEQELFCRLQTEYKKNNPQFDAVFVDKMDREGLLRHFYSSLILNTYTSSSQGLYYLAGWPGFNLSAQKVQIPKLNPSQALVVSNIETIGFNPKLEAYRYIQVGGRFRIIEKSHPDFLKKLEELYPKIQNARESYLILNATSTTIP